jgi:hypothetical protein
MNKKINKMIQEYTTHYRDDGAFVTLKKSGGHYSLEYNKSDGTPDYSILYVNEQLQTINDLAEDWALRKETP